MGAKFLLAPVHWPVGTAAFGLLRRLGLYQARAAVGAVSILGVDHMPAALVGALHLAGVAVDGSEHVVESGVAQLGSLEDALVHHWAEHLVVDQGVGVGGAGEEVVEGLAEGVDVGGEGELSAEALLGGGVGQRAGEGRLARCGHHGHVGGTGHDVGVGAHHLGYAEVDDFHRALGGEEEV